MYTYRDTSNQHIQVKKSIGQSLIFQAILIFPTSPPKWEKMPPEVGLHLTQAKTAEDTQEVQCTDFPFP